MSKANIGNVSMVRLFLSYAEEDRKAAGDLEVQLLEKGFEVYNWRDPARQGGRIVEDLERAISEAHAFLVVLSPDYITSPWCRLERSHAIHHEMDRRVRHPDASPFIYVLRIADTPQQDLGFLKDYRQFDLSSPPAWEEALRVLVEKFQEDAQSVSASALLDTTTAEQVPARFRNRRDELDMLVRALTNAGGRHFWVVVAPPQLGKSWFLDQLSAEMPAEPEWVRKLVDVSLEPLDVRLDASLVLARLFRLQPPIAIGPEVLLDIATRILDVGKPYLCLLDGADLLEERTAKELRAHLSTIYQHLRSAPQREVRLAFVAASRRQDDWKGVYPEPRMSPLDLTEFNVYVVNDALHDIRQAHHLDIGNEALWRTAEHLHRISEGLPALLAESIRWLQATHWADRERLKSQELFERFAGSYIEQALFSVASLVPWGGKELEKPRYALEYALRMLASYRLFTVSHLDHHVSSDTQLSVILQDVGWPVHELWRALGRTALVSQPLHEPWQRIFPAVRRLLFRYYYSTSDQQVTAHRTACEFYERWGKDRPAGGEQGAMLVESLWHEAERLKLEQPSTMDLDLTGYARERSQILKMSAFDEEELRNHTVRLMRDDDELQEAVAHVSGLFERLVAIIEPPP
jgi:hypothetical protein